MFKGQTAFEWLMLLGGAILLVILAVSIFTGFLSNESTKKTTQLNVQEAAKDCLTYKSIGNGYYPPFNSFTQAYFPFRGTPVNNTLADTSDNRRTLSLSGENPIAGYSSDTEKGPNALLFNSSNALVFVGGTSGLNVNTKFTLEFWFEPLSINSKNYLLNSSDSLGVWFDSTTVNLVGSVIAPITMTVVANAWNYLAISYDGTNAVFYLNGKNTGSAPFSFTSTSSNLSIAGNASAYINGLNGYLDLIRISNVTRDDSAISTASICEDSINDMVQRS